VFNRERICLTRAVVLFQISKEDVVRESSLLRVVAPSAAPSASVNPCAEDDGLVGRAPALQEVRARIRRVAPTDTTVLITGETGTGKELVARAIHGQSRRAARPMVAAHLAAVPEGLIGSELFGHERGAFTGAERIRIGRFEQADRGTLFLDEVGELPAYVQVALLRVLQEGDVERVGGSQVRRVNVRVVAATNRNLEEAQQQGLFRPDLFYRLNVVPIQLPPLRERRDDVEMLALHFLQHAATRLGRRFDGIEPASLDHLRACAWPGNIRQLQNVVEHSAVLCDGPQLCVSASLVADRRTAAATPAGKPRLTLEEMKRRYIRHVLATTRGNMPRAATLLGIDRRSLYRMVERYRIERGTRHRLESGECPEGAGGPEGLEDPSGLESPWMNGDLAADGPALAAW
jgi:DNA-binding NtrC family response regulator